MYMSSGPQAHHSPQIAAGEATLMMENYKNILYGMEL